MRKVAIGVTLGLLAAGAVLLALPGGPARDTADDAVALTELGDDPPFRIALGGPLWRDRIVHGGDGGQDFALVAGDQPLEVEVRGSAKVRVAGVELRVDGRRQQLVSPTCAERRCPSRLRLTLTARLRQLLPGDHRIEVVARDSRAAGSSGDTGRHLSVQGFHVRTVARLPAVAEGEPVGRLPARPVAPRGDPDLERSALRVLGSERRSGGLATALGKVRLKLVHLGALNARGQRLGVTMLVDLVSPRRDVWATVPAYVPSKRSSAPPYTAQRVRMHVAVLRDALIDVDLGRRRVIAFEPGPRSKSLRWSPSLAPAPAGAGDED